MRKSIHCLLLIFVIIQCTCTYDKIRVVDPEFEPFIELFRQEAAMRNIDVLGELEDISIAFGDIEEAGVSGTCFLYSEPNDFILIDSVWWNTRLNFEEKEHLIFKTW